MNAMREVDAAELERVEGGRFRDPFPHPDVPLVYGEGPPQVWSDDWIFPFGGIPKKLG
jgi:hypothetical protein